MAIRTILPQGIKTEEDDAPKKFTNIDAKDFDFRWNSKWKRVQSGYTVIMPKYLVNYAAYHLARKMFKRDSLKAWEESPAAQRQQGFPTIRDDASEVKLQLKMVVQNPGIRDEFVNELENKNNIEILSGISPEALDNASEPGAKQLDKEGTILPAEDTQKDIEVLEKAEDQKTPPVESIGSSKPEVPKEGFKCEKCGFVAKSEFGLKSHMRKHQEKKGATK